VILIVTVVATTMFIDIYYYSARKLILNDDAVTYLDLSSPSQVLNFF